jgi:hypothetical protein
MIASAGVACDRGTPAVQTGGVDEPVRPDAVAPQQRWPAPDAGPVHIRRELAADLTGDGRSERITVAARGPQYEQLDISLVIAGADGDTLWADRWESAYYFYYDPLEGKSAEEVAAIVQGHVDALLADDRFHTGMPPAMAGGDPTDMIHESVRYHLAELDWRNRADLDPADELPEEAYARLRPDDVALARVRVVAEELSTRPTYNYFAGGEASYVIGWSERERAFVRLFACC